jgi:PKD repeat protein
VSADDGDDIGSDDIEVTVANVDPEMGAIVGPLGPVLINTATQVSVPFTDDGTADTHTCLIDWGDGTSSAGTVVEASGSGTCTGSHTYTVQDIYTVTITVTDDDGGSDTETFEFIVVFDPEGGFVTGGGWFNSLPGAYPGDPAATGKANFGFVSKYKKGSHIPDGNTEFQFKAGNLNFHSTAYEIGSLVISGSKATYKGTGKINGVAGYSFRVVAIDGDSSGAKKPDAFRIKIWVTGSPSNVVYDNEMGAADDAADASLLGGGSIVIHSPKK